MAGLEDAAGLTGDLAGVDGRLERPPHVQPAPGRQHVLNHLLVNTRVLILHAVFKPPVSVVEKNDHWTILIFYPILKPPTSVGEKELRILYIAVSVIYENDMLTISEQENIIENF